MIDEINETNHTTLIINETNLHALGHWCTAIDNIVKRSNKVVASIKFSHIADKSLRMDIYTQDKIYAAETNS